MLRQRLRERHLTGTAGNLWSSLLVLLVIATPIRADAVGDPPPFPGERSTWNGYDRFGFEVDGKPVLVVAPKQAAAGRPWVWHGEFFGHKPAPDVALLGKGFHIVYMRVPNMLGSPRAVQHWDAFYRELTGKYGFAKKAALVGLSRGGLYCYNWAAANPDKVACIYGDAPVCDFKSWPGGKGKGKGSQRDWKLVLECYGFKSEAEALAYDKNPVDNLERLAKAKVPLLHVYGDADETVPWEENTGLVAERYRKLGGRITLIGKKGVGHHPHGLDDPTPIVEFIAEHAAKLTLPRDKRPEWLSQEGLVMAGSWEALPFRVRRDGAPGYTPTAEQLAGWEREHSPEMIGRLKDLGVTFVMMHCYKGGGLEQERESMAAAVQFSRRCHEAGLHVGAYTYSGAFLWEPLFKENPGAKDWVLLDENGKPPSYGSADYRYYWNRNHPEAVEFYKEIVKFAVNDIGVDLVHLDNYVRGPSHDACSARRFRDYLARTFTPMQLKQMGLEKAEEAKPPKKGGANAFLVRAWQDFCCRSLADSYHEMGRYARSLREDVLMECNPGGLRARLHAPVDHGRLLEGGEAIWNEGFIGGLRNGKLHTGIPTYKLARRMGNMVFRYVRDPRQMAEAMAFNLDCLGCLCWFEYGELSDYPGKHGEPLKPETAPFVRFYRTRRELFRDTNVVADVAVLRSFPSQMFGPAEFAGLTNRAIDELIAGRACFQIICDQHLAELDRYRVLVLAGCGAMSDAQIGHVKRFVDGGGRLSVTGPLATHDAWMFPRKKSALADLPAERVLRVETGDDMALAVNRALEQKPALSFSTKTGSPNGGVKEDALLGVCAELTERGGQRFVHLVNYREADPVKDIVVRLRVPDERRVKEVVLASPGRGRDLEVPFSQDGGFVTFEVPQVDVYEVGVVSVQ